VLKPEKTTSILSQMIENGWLGNKSGQGFYKKTFVNGKREFWTLNPDTMDYEPPEKVRFGSVGAVRKSEKLHERLPALLKQDEDQAVTYIRDTLYYNLGYAAYVTPEIAFRLSDVDDALRWGFGQEAGPFEVWDMLGVSSTVEKMEAAGIEVADWVKEMLASGCETFYKNGSSYDFESKSYTPTPFDIKIFSFEQMRDGGNEVARNMSASLLDMGDGVGLLEMHSPKINALDPDFFEMAKKALARLETDFDALVIGNQGQDFCIGANIAVLVMAASQGMWDQIEQMVLDGQKIFYKLHHAPKPVITAPHQRVLGGGVELTMAGWGSVADHETYIGFVEVGVGLLPAACGCLHMIRRKINPVMRTKNADVLPIMQEVFEQLALAKVGASAWEDMELGYLQSDDVINMNSDQRLVRAKERALTLVASGARPPEEEKVYAAGRDALAALNLGLQTFAWADYASEHDLKIGRKIANVLCGGDISGPAWVDPWHILDLEREAFVSLAGEPLTQARIAHMLQTGKPLRN
jgi:3-hydroxyacyl-CoA dehydrogenase